MSASSATPQGRRTADINPPFPRLLLQAEDLLVRAGVLLVLLLVAPLARAGDTAAPDWRLEAFGEANRCYAKMQDDEKAFIVGREPALGDLYRDVIDPWQNAMLRLRRLVFARKLGGPPGLLRMDQSPWVWALSTPARQDEIAVWLRDDKDGSVRAAYGELKRCLGAMRLVGGPMQRRSEVVDANKSDVYAIERAAAKELDAIEGRVRDRLAARN